jgi:hypothetical protein
MADPPPDTGDDTGVGPDREATTGTPRWVKVSGTIALLLVVLFVILKLTGLGGEHGPGRHSPAVGSETTSDTAGGHTGPPPGVTHGEQQP